MPKRSYPTVVAAFRKKIKAIDMATILIALMTVLFFRGFFQDYLGWIHLAEWIIVFSIPFLFAIFLSGNQSWESEAYVGTLKFYEIPLRASLKTLIWVAAFAYLIKEPVSRITVILVLITSTLGILGARFVFSKSSLVKILTSKTADYLVIASHEDFKEVELTQPVPNQVKTSYIHREPKVKDCVQEWDDICDDLEKENFVGLIIGDSYLPSAEVIAKISTLQSKKNLEVFFKSQISTLVPRMQSMDSTDLFRINPPLLIGRHSFIKRTLDVALSVFSLIFLFPILLLIALGVLLSSPGPVFYIDQRIGRNNKLFSFPKFRSMVVNADQMRSTVLGSPDESMPDRYARDPRITGFGRFIRRWSLDELPQLWCVLIGTMSIVGPRPILREEDIDVQKVNQSRFIAKPGLTGLWQVSGRKEVLWEARMQQDILYIETWSFLKDLLLILRTFGTIISGKGAM